MAWVTPITWTLAQVVTYTQMNTIRDALNETAPAKATTTGYHFVSTGTNSIAERAILQAVVDTQETTTSTAYTDLTTPGPAVTLTTGSKAFVWISAQIANSGAGQTYASYSVSGATTQAASDNVSLEHEENGGAASFSRVGVSDLRTVSAGVNTFTMQYRVTSLTGSYLRRRIQVMGL